MAIPLSFSFLSLLVVLAVLLSPLLLLAAAGRKARGNTAAGARQLPTGPAKLPIIGNIHLLFTGNPLHQTLRELSKKHGPLMHLQLGCTPTVVVSSAELAEEVLKTHDLKCCSRPLLVAFAKLSYGYSDIATTPYSDRWRKLRKFSTVELFSHKMIGSSRSIREQEIERVMEVIRARSIVDLRELLMSFSCNATCRSAFGRGYDEAGSGKLHELVEEAQAVISTVFVADYFPAMGWVDVLSGARRRLHRVHLKLDRAYQGIIDEHLDRSGGQNGEREDIVDALLRLKETEEITDDQIKGVFMVRLCIDRYIYIMTWFD
ncbi:hypothetical protein Cni_G13800 [Canna indica]|uniref:Cytochrome P450 n=1 Tax=Canna indica TaxID=4628 RepID=A0AAQ3KAI8_9LILI|nr:hypothetical protein Cni_G13800 [Canna indica]